MEKSVTSTLREPSKSERSPEPVRPNTIATSIAIGNPADGYQVIQSVRATGGGGAAVSDEQIVDAIRLLAETEGIFTEPAGGTTLAAAMELVRRGAIPRDESIVVCVTGNGYKTAEVVAKQLNDPVRLTRSFKDFETWWHERDARLKASEDARLKTSRYGAVSVP